MRGKLPISNVRLHTLQHIDCGLVKSDKDTIVDLPEAQQLEDLSGGGVNTIDTVWDKHGLGGEDFVNNR